MMKKPCKENDWEGIETYDGEDCDAVVESYFDSLSRKQRLKFFNFSMSYDGPLTPFIVCAMCLDITGRI